MKKRNLAAALTILAAATSKVSAQLVYEPFDYGSASHTGNAAKFSDINNVGNAATNVGYINPQAGQWFNAGVGANPANNVIISGGSNVLTQVSGLAPFYGDAGGAISDNNNGIPSRI